MAATICRSVEDKQIAPNSNRIEDLIIGGYQLAYVVNWSGGLPYTVNMGGGFPAVNGVNQDCNHNTGSSSSTVPLRIPVAI